MEETKQTPNDPVQPVSPEQAAEIAGGDGCSTTTVSLGPISITTSGSLTDLYNGAVDATSQAMTDVANALK
jgi:hypothetical protein